MNLRDMQYLVAVADLKHFGKAAKACFVSQPALSMQLKKLEETLDVQLFERTNKHVLVTRAGEHIVSRARLILQEVESIKEIAKLTHDPFSGDLKLGAFPTLAPYVLPHIVPRISADCPNLRLLLIEEKTDILIKKLEAGEIDAALLALPIESDFLESHAVLKDEFYLAAPPNHPLAKRKKIHSDDLRGESLLLLEEGHCLREQALDVCSRIGSGEKQDFRATSLETLRQMVASGVGITLIPKLAQSENDSIAYIPFTTPAPSRTIGLVWRKTSARKACFEKLTEIMKESAL